MSDIAIDQDAQETDAQTQQREASQLIAFSYTPQRSEISPRAQQLSVLLSANISTYAATVGAHDDEALESRVEDQWFIVMDRRSSPELLDDLQCAIELADVDERRRSLIAPSGVELSSRAPSSSSIREKLRRRFEEEYAELGYTKSLSQQLNLLLNTQHEPLETLVGLETMSEADISTLESSSTLSDSKIEERGHLLIVSSGALEEITPRLTAHSLRCFLSVSVLTECQSSNILSWHRWSNAVGATLLYLATSDRRMRDQVVSRFADRLQRASLGLRRAPIHLSLSADFALTSATQLTGQAGPLSLDVNPNSHGGKRQGFWIELPTGDQRWSALLNFKFQWRQLQNNQDPNRRSTTFAHVHIGSLKTPLKIAIVPQSSEEKSRQRRRVQDLHFNHPLGLYHHSDYDQLQLGVAFAQQISHHIRVIDSLLLSLLKQEARKPAKLLDQLIKIAIALNALDQATVLREMKLEFLATGQLSTHGRVTLTEILLTPNFRLSHEGRWIALF